MAHGHFHPLRENRAHQRAGILSAVDFLVLRHQRVPSQRVVVLPACKRADTTNRCFHDLETAAVTLAPNHALMIGGCDLASLQRYPSVSIEDELSVEETPVVTLVHSQYHDHAVPTCLCSDGIGDRTRH